jgi:hypothetical protein
VSPTCSINLVPKSSILPSAVVCVTYWCRSFSWKIPKDLPCCRSHCLKRGRCWLLKTGLRKETGSCALAHFWFTHEQCYLELVDDNSDVPDYIQNLNHHRASQPYTSLLILHLTSFLENHGYMPMLSCFNCDSPLWNTLYSSQGNMEMQGSYSSKVCIRAILIIG